MKGQYINIDADKLRGELKIRKLTTPKASTEMGYNSYFLTNSINRGTLSVPAVVLLDRLYGIKRESYEIVPAAEPEPEPEPEQVPEPAPNSFVSLNQTDRRLWQMTGEDLYRVIYSASFAAFSAAIKGCRSCTPD